MRKFFCFIAAAGLILALAGTSGAAEFKASGSAEVVFEAAGNYGVFEQGRYALQDGDDVRRNYGESYHPPHSRAIQRFILQFDFIASENLSAHYDAIAGFFTWGGPAAGAGPAVGGAIGTRAVNFTTRQAYLDWAVPHTRVKVRMGLQLWSLPTFASGSLSPHGDEFGTGILATAPINDAVTLTGAWIRGVSGLRRGNVATSLSADDNVDLFLLTLPINLDGARFAPWAAFGVHGGDSSPIAPANSYTAISTSNADDGGNTMAGYADINARLLAEGKRGLASAAAANGTSWFLGFGGEITRFAPWRFALDAQYSAFETRGEVRDRSGWLVGAAIDYKTAWGVPSLRGWYASGDDRNPLNGSERAISFAGSANSKNGANTVFSSSSNMGGNMMLSLKGAIAGTWGLSLLWSGASFSPDLTHNFAVSYVQGTNHRDMARYANPRFVQNYLTTEDSLVAINLESLYKIYANLHYVFEMTYIFQNIDGDVWARGIAPGTQRTAGVDELHFSNAWRIGMNFRYFF